MKRICQRLSLLYLLCLLSAGCGPSAHPSKASDSSKLAVNTADKAHTDSVEKDFRERIIHVAVGDLNKDGINDTVIVYPPRFNQPGDQVQGCRGDTCYCKLSFSCKLPDLNHVLGTGEYIANVGDLDQNGYDEIAMVPEWPTSVWQALFVYGYRNGSWQLLGQGSVNTGTIDSDPEFIKRRVRTVDSRHFIILSDSLSAETDSIFQAAKIVTLK